MSLCQSGVFIVRLQESKKQTNNFLPIFSSSLYTTKEKVKSNINTNFGFVKYFDNVSKIDSSTDC